MLPHSDTLSWFWANQSLFFFLNAACVDEKQQIPILPDRDSNSRSTTVEGEPANHYTTDAVDNQRSEAHTTKIKQQLSIKTGMNSERISSYDYGFCV